jgi:hypothetical protein
VDLSLIAGERRAAADPPVQGIIDVRYRLVNGQWLRTLVLNRGSTECTAPPDAECDFTSNCAIGSGITRTPAAGGASVEIPAETDGFYDTTFALNVRYNYLREGGMSYDCTVGGVTTRKTTFSSETYSAQVAEALPAHNQAVDSRYDLRYGNPTYLDFPFGNRAYRGGLFAGFANDPSRVGRSYLKFTLPTAPMGSNGRWVSTLNAYFTRLFTPGSVDVEARRSTDVLWTESGITWSSAPTFNAAEDTQTVTYDPGSGDTGQRWTRWKIHDDAEAAYNTAQLSLTEVLTSASEGTNGWAYFAKRQYETGHEPRLFVVFKF